MDKIKDVVRGLNNAFPEGNEPFKIITRLAEECGELAKEVNHWERTGNKVKKYGEPDKGKLAKEVQDVIRCALQVAFYYEIEEELDASIDKAYQNLKAENLI